MFRTEHNQSYKAYVCDKCDYATDKKKRLDKHLAIDHSIGNIGRFKNLQCRDCKSTFAKPDQLSEHTEKVHGKKLESYACIPAKRGRGRPPKHSFINTGYVPPSQQDLTHIRPPAKRERTFYSSDEDEESEPDSEEDLGQLDEDDYDWKPTAAGLSAKKAQMLAKRGPSKRGRKPKRPPMEIYVPKTEIKDEPSSTLEASSADEATAEEVTTIVDEHGQVIAQDQPQEIVYETTYDDQAEVLDGSSKIISITKKEPTEDQDPNESIKFAVKTRGNPGEAPVEFEVELKDQKLIASGQLEDQTQTVMNLLSEGNVVDAILQNLAGVAQEQVGEILENQDGIAEEDDLDHLEKIETRKRWESKVIKNCLHFYKHLLLTIL